MKLVVLNETGEPIIVAREAEGVARSENVLRDMVFAHPAMLPVHDVDPGYGTLVPVARELNVPGVGRIDALLVDDRGRLVIVEAKLWRNPQARREVVGQILDYARELARWSYEDLQREVSSATKRQGNVLFDLVREAGGDTDEARFVDQVSRDLTAGRFLLLIVGDGITEGTQRIGEFLANHAGLAFDFGMVEIAQYNFNDPATGASRSIVQPRLITKTVLIERTIIRNEARGVEVVSAVDEERAPVNPRQAAGPKVTTEAQQQWRDFVERFVANTRFDDPGQAPARAGGLNWMRVPLPAPSSLTLWRSAPNNVVGAFARFTGSEGLAVYERLLSDQAEIDREFAEAGLPVPAWEAKDDTATIAVSWPSPAPWSPGEEDRQIELLGAAANRFVNSLRSRLAQVIA